MLQYTDGERTNEAMHPSLEAVASNSGRRCSYCPWRQSISCGGIMVQFSSISQSCLTLCDCMDCSMSGFPVHRACSNSCPLSRWCHPTISSSALPFSSCLQSCPASVSFPTSWLFASGDQSIGVSASASVLPMNIQDLFPLGLTSLISLQSKGLSRVFSNTFFFF